MATPKRRVLQTLDYYFQNLQQDHHVLAVCLYGSQNYQLDTSFSDIDAYAILLPDAVEMTFASKGSLKHKQTKSKLVSFPTGQVTLKSLPAFMQMLLNQAFTSLETLYTPYQIVHPDYQEEWNELLKVKEKLFDFDLYHQMLIAHSMTQRELDTFIQHYETDPATASTKNLARACHMIMFMQNRLQDMSFEQSLCTENKEYHEILMELKQKKTIIQEDDTLLPMAYKLKQKDAHRWEHFKNTHASLPNEDPAVLELQKELAQVVMPIFTKHTQCLCQNPSEEPVNYEDCIYFEAVETDEDTAFDHPQYQYYCNYQEQHKKIYPCIACKRCTKAGYFHTLP